MDSPVVPKMIDKPTDVMAMIIASFRVVGEHLGELAQLALGLPQVLAEEERSRGAAVGRRAENVLVGRRLTLGDGDALRK